MARPAIATEQLSEPPDGRIAYELRHPWSDDTTRAVFEPQSFPEKLAALIPEGTVVRAMLECLGLPADGPVIHPVRGPPELF